MLYFRKKKMQIQIVFEGFECFTHLPYARRQLGERKNTGSGS